jgi:hypothetical protein
MDFEVGKAFGPLLNIVERQIESVQDGTSGGGNFRIGAAEPGLSVGNWGSAHSYDPWGRK